MSEVDYCNDGSCVGFSGFENFWKRSDEWQCHYFRVLAAVFAGSEYTDACGSSYTGDRAKLLHGFVELSNDLRCSPPSGQFGCSGNVDQKRIGGYVGVDRDIGKDVSAIKEGAAGLVPLDGEHGGVPCYVQGSCATRAVERGPVCEIYSGGSDGVGERECGALSAHVAANGLDRRVSRTEENRKKREKNKVRKLRKRAASDCGEKKRVDLPSGENRGSDVEVLEWRRRDVDLPKGENHGDGLGRNGKPLKESVGFWKSCSDDVRQRLIDSKAEMHIAENRKKTLEAMARVDYLSSAQACVDKVVSLVARAKQIAEQEGNAAVLGWAQTVTSSSVESVARSAPSTVPSFDIVSSAIDEAEKLKAEREKAEEERLLAERMATIVKLTREADEQKEVEKALRETIARLEKERKPAFQRNAGGSAAVNSRCYDGSKYYDAEMEAAHKKRADEVANRKKGVVYDRFDALLGVDKGRLLTRAEYLERSR